MPAIQTTISKFISDAQPGFVECIFKDVWDHEHIIQEKIPVVTNEDLDQSSDYPRDGTIACEILKEWMDDNGRKIITVTTEKPWSIESMEGLVEFDLTEEQLIEISLS